MEIYSIVIYSSMVLWAAFAIYYMIRLQKRGADFVVPYVYETIPSVFTTLGVLGTFVGIYFGLRHFNVNAITQSIPDLLEGLKSAFTTSIWGISLALVFGKITQIVLNNHEKNLPSKPKDELTALQTINASLNELKNEAKLNAENLKSAIVVDAETSLSELLIQNNNELKSIGVEAKRQLEATNSVVQSIGPTENQSILQLIVDLKMGQDKGLKDLEKYSTQLKTSNQKGTQDLLNKFGEFSEILAKNNTEALVEVMKSATEQFNLQMTALIEKLVQENFKELNNSVSRMNSWQQENKIMISDLTNQFTKVSEDFSLTSVSINEITKNTSSLTNENSHLVELIAELQKVMIDDTKFERIVSKLSKTVETMESNTEAFDETTLKLNDWVRNQMNFNDSVAKLLVRLEDIDKIKDINELFWQNTKKQLEQGVSLLEQGSENLSNDLDSINDEFYNRLNDTLQNLDTLIQRIISNYN